ncbi:Uncharacterised protein [Legionella quateirensis]|uniref:Uncharacterized protein n=1 Tax=Legionella quateirensis TaxID=45072 RepID=A0A378PAC4_9GAMM|nr:Uncharacterised protein [Legionella quateirensis]
MFLDNVYLFCVASSLSTALAVVNTAIKVLVRPAKLLIVVIMKSDLGN